MAIATIEICLHEISNWKHMALRVARKQKKKNLLEALSESSRTKRLQAKK